ncbi:MULTISPECIES: ABC transporter substrate-binding protein [unclassified Pseudomonas]|nr:MULTISPECIES: ABC transporter substrate-binding protein [unclassified Pseudomonas]
MLFGLIITPLSQAQQVIKFGVDPSYPPFEQKQPDGSLSGFDIDLGNALCAELSVKCIWVEQNFDGMVPALKAKKFDAILSAFSATEARRQQVDFSHKIYTAPSSLVARKNAGLLPTAASLKGKSVGVVQGSLQESFAKSEWGSQGVEILSYQTQDQVFSDLINGRLEAAFQASVQADIGLLQKPQGQGFAFAGDPITDKRIIGDGVAIGVRKNEPDLREQLNTAIAGIRQSGQYDRIAKQYFNFDIYGE